MVPAAAPRARRARPRLGLTAPPPPGRAGSEARTPSEATLDAERAVVPQALGCYADATALIRKSAEWQSDLTTLGALAVSARPLGISELDLLSNNPDKAAQLRTLGLTVTQHVPTGVLTTAHNVRYLRAKVVRTQHTLPLAELPTG